MTTFTRITNIGDIGDTTPISQILYDNVPVAWIEYDYCKNVIIHYKDDWYYINDKNITVRDIVTALGYKRPIVTWVAKGERYEVLDELIMTAHQNTIRIFTNPKEYLEYSEYDDFELE